MFLDSSRYAKVPTDQTVTAEGRTLTALRLRRLPPTQGEPRAVQDNDRLDLLAHAGYADAARFWHIADANSALDARTLTEETGAEIRVPGA
jgi:hypothetical protein